METANSRFFLFPGAGDPARLCLRFEFPAPPPLRFPDPHSAGKIRENIQPVIADRGPFTFGTFPLVPWPCAKNRSKQPD